MAKHKKIYEVQINEEKGFDYKPLRGLFKANNEIHAIKLMQGKLGWKSCDGYLIGVRHRPFIFRTDDSKFAVEVLVMDSETRCSYMTALVFGMDKKEAISHVRLEYNLGAKYELYSYTERQYDYIQI